MKINIVGNSKLTVDLPWTHPLSDQLPPIRVRLARMISRRWLRFWCKHPGAGDPSKMVASPEGIGACIVCGKQL